MFNCAKVVQLLRFTTVHCVMFYFGLSQVFLFLLSLFSNLCLSDSQLSPHGLLAKVKDGQDKVRGYFMQLCLLNTLRLQ